MAANSSEGSGDAPGQTGCDPSKEIREAFAALPFERKISTLVRIQFDLLGEAADSIVCAASKAANDIVEAFAPPEGGDAPPNAETQAPNA